MQRKKAPIETDNTLIFHIFLDEDALVSCRCIQKE